ncbi:Deoxyribose-phosphate aldolase (EC [Olavius algarvensis Delta 1 endosymbiont]|nr:Deoxyribose-phosphate aldolase (EC [Olavius algarvensis Delta 1 endosymbiont]
MVLENSFKLTAAEMARYIDHTLLKPEATPMEFDKLCEEAVRYGFKAVCVNSGRVAYVAEKLRGTEVAVCSVVGFPLGAMHRRVKAFEAHKAVGYGAQELDMVLNVGALKAGDLNAVGNDILAVRAEARIPVVLKVIIETCLLTDAEKVKACEIAQKAGADFVKTSTGFSTGGATLEDVALMRETVDPAIGVKASGGIKDYETAAAMIAAGATRIGAGAGVAIVEGAES